jgi:hypothetical protein
MSKYIKRRIAVGIIVLVPVALLFSNVIDSKYNYSCPTASVTVERGDTLSGITERHCKGHTLQASWDIANERGTSTLDTGDLIQLSDK